MFELVIFFFIGTFRRPSRLIGQSVWLSVSQHTGSGASEEHDTSCLVPTPPTILSLALWLLGYQQNQLKSTMHSALIPEPAAPRWRCVPQQQPCAAGSYQLWFGHLCWHQLSAIHPQWSNDHAELPGGVGTSLTTGQVGRDRKTGRQTSNSGSGFISYFGPTTTWKTMNLHPFIHCWRKRMTWTETGQSVTCFWNMDRKYKDKAQYSVVYYWRKKTITFHWLRTVWRCCLLFFVGSQTKQAWKLLCGERFCQLGTENQTVWFASNPNNTFYLILY